MFVDIRGGGFWNETEYRLDAAIDAAMSKEGK